MSEAEPPVEAPRRPDDTPPRGGGSAVADGTGAWRGPSSPPRRRTDLERWACSAASQAGPGRAVNQDAFAALPACGLFVVADGMGGHAEGEVASRTIARLLGGSVDPEAPLRLMTALVEEGIATANAMLRGRAAVSTHGDLVAATVAAAIVGEDRLVGLWAGDCRIYLWRAGELVRLTADHAPEDDLFEEGGVTRGVGCAAHVTLGRVEIETARDDAILICSDGLTKGLPDRVLARMLERPELGTAENLLLCAETFGARDDVTAIVARRLR